MYELLEDANPAFIAWAEKEGINLEEVDDFDEWLKCWGDGYVHGVNDVKQIIRGSYLSTPEEQEPTIWTCCGIAHPINKRCQCGETAH